MSEHETARPANGQVYRDNFESINWGGNRPCDWEALAVEQMSKYTVPCDSEGKELVWNPLTFGYE